MSTAPYVHRWNTVLFLELLISVLNTKLLLVVTFPISRFPQSRKCEVQARNFNVSGDSPDRILLFNRSVSVNLVSKGP
jgi:hypothetical protein